MWLKYGIDENGTLVNISDVTKGKTSLKCPYCDCKLTAKKGKIKEHHFAHTKQTCRPVLTREFPVLPLYDNFDIHLSSKDFQQLKLLWKEYGSAYYFISPDLVPSGLIRAGLLQKNISTFPYQYEFTNLGKIPIGALELMLFNEVQEPLLLKKLLKLELAVEHALHKNAPDLDYIFTDLKLYCAQFKRILSCRLYFLEIYTNQDTLHKIGVTQRPISERLAEIKIDLLAHYQSVDDIKVLGTWEHRGNVELYFKHRYRDFNYPIGNLTEYYKFQTEDVKIVLGDLQQMKPKVLNSVEIDLLKVANERINVKM
ncbi:GIY-YIG nuclease family protein [Brasilonema sp. UFV-L1]|uniref:competence protein CoiA family protein n=1 Tax=Brasilonema sp. UFV-L1 TaxID=2234130 RepID=UPI00145DFD19|nr:GIY-YIG nuclease family protein [Brasilonema sp. UFV-L1]NMG08777.1 GIY-YIG nuclease family protein [Brasilonema sp. UFV-L1]